VRQLQNFLERVLVLSDGDAVTLADVERELARTPLGGAAGAGAGGDAGTLDASKRAAERDALKAALDRAGGNRALAARILGISRRSLYYKLAEHGVAG
jgi:two-component system response regulator AtoC